MTLDDINHYDTLPRTIGSDYDNHIVFKYLEIIKTFYNTISLGNNSIEIPALFSKTKVFSTIGYIYSSIEGTIESISVLLHNGRCNDAFALVRKYCDSIILDIYKYIIVEEIDEKFQGNLSIESIKNNKIKSWIDSEEALFTEKQMNKIYATIKEKYPDLTNLFDLSNKNTLYHKLREICNDNMHYNYFYNMMANDYEIIKLRKDIRDSFIKNIKDAVVLFFTIHFAFIYKNKPIVYMSLDYINYLDCGMTPPRGSERWVSLAVQNAFDDIIKTNKPEVATFLKDLDLMDLE